MVHIKVKHCLNKVTISLTASLSRFRHFKKAILFGYPSIVQLVTLGMHFITQKVAVSTGFNSM